MTVQWKHKPYGKFMEEGKRTFTLDSVDPLANSWIYSDCAPNLDPRLEVIDYDRTWEEDEALGLHDMVVDDKEVEKRNEEERKKKLEDAAKEVVEEEVKDRKKEQELVEKLVEEAEKKKEPVV